MPTKELGLTMGLCVVFSGLAWFYLGDSVYVERGGLKPVAHYARSVHSETLDRVLRLGAEAGHDIVMPDLSSEDSGRLLLRENSWQLAPGPSGDSVGSGSEDARGLALPIPGKYSFRGNVGRLTLEVEEPVRIDVTKRGSNDLFGIWLRQNSRRPISRGGMTFRSDGAEVSIEHQGRVGRVTRFGQLSINDATVFWRKNDGTTTPLFITSGDSTELIWPGESRYLASVGGVIALESGRHRALRISSTDPSATLESFPGGAVPGKASGAISDILRFNGRSYQIRTFGYGNVNFVALYRIQKSTPLWSFLVGGSFHQWRDPAIYSPNRFIPLTECASQTLRIALWIPSEKSNLPESIIGSGESRVTQSVRVEYRPVLLTPPTWVTAAARGRGAVFCRQGDEYRVTGLTESGTVIPPPVDAVWRSHERIPQLLDRDRSLLSPGDIVFIAGQGYLLTASAMPRSLKLITALTPFPFVLAAWPLAWVLSCRMSRQWRAIRQATISVDWYPRAALMLGPIVVLAAITGMLTIGAYFQLRLAVSSRLAGSPVYFSTFLTSGVEALATAALLVRLLDTNFNLKRLPRSAAFAFLSLALGTVALLWIQPAIYAAACASQFPAGLPSSARLTLLEMLIPAVFLIIAWLLYLLPDPLPDKPIKDPRRLDWWQRFLSCYHDSYDAWVTPTSRRENIQPRILKPVSFYLAWAIFPACLLRWSYINKDSRWPRTHSGRFLRAVEMAVCISPLVLLAVGARLFTPIANLGKEAVPAVIVLWAAWVLGRVSFYVQATQETNAHRPGPVEWLGNAVMAGSSLVFFSGILLLPYFFDWIYEPAIIAKISFILLVAILATRYVPAWRAPAALLFHILPFFGVLLFCSFVFNDFGALLVWTWALSWVGAFALMLNVLLADPQLSWRSGIGALPTSTLLLSLPLTILGGFNYLRQTFGWLGEVHGLMRPIGRFRLVAAPFYYDSGEWLARVQLMAAGEQGIQWIPNLNSDVALNGLRYFLPKEHFLFIGLFSTVVIVLLLAFTESFRYAARSPEIETSTENLRTALVTATALFGLGMLLFVHLGASVFDILPLTGVPCPWLSNAFVCHIVMTCLIIGVLVMASERAERDHVSIHASK